MKELSPQEQEAIRQQEEQCIFCKIVKGEIESKKVYEDDEIIAILDINPASKGHLLIMPKKHYPIMPLIPPKTFKHLSTKIKELSYSLRQSMICQGTTLFIANGAAAGQQSNHFMLHLIPREDNDGLGNFEIKEEEISQDDLKEGIKNNFRVMMQRYLIRVGKSAGKAEAPKTKPIPEIPKKISEEHIIKLIETNPQLKFAVEKQPEEFKKLATSHPQLKVLFKEINIDKIIRKFSKKDDEGKETEKEDISREEVKEVKEMLGKKGKTKKKKKSDEEKGKEEGREDKKEEVNLDDIAGLFK